TLRRLADQVAIALVNSLAIQVRRLQAQSEPVGAVDAKQQVEEHATLLQATTQSSGCCDRRLRHQQSATLVPGSKTVLRSRDHFPSRSGS
ncbi:MAG: hypothetical protein IPP12_17880, partial [Nitrospira sp.]|nr:hypothetical protein [Nitrospira sp.]